MNRGQTCCFYQKQRDLYLWQTIIHFVIYNNSNLAICTFELQVTLQQVWKGETVATPWETPVAEGVDMTLTAFNSVVVTGSESK